MKIADNRLLSGTAIALGLYWLVAFALSWQTFSLFINMSLVVASGLVWLRSIPETFDILFRGLRNESAPEGDGSHLAVYGVNLIGLGGIIAALASFALAIPFISGYVSHTPLEFFGRAIATAGLGLWFVSPNVSRHGVRFTGGAWFYLVAALMMIVVYAVGYSAGFREERQATFEDDEHIPLDRPRCGLERPIWGTKQGVYHTEDSPYRKLVLPMRCFATETEARAAGFKAPG